MVKCSYANACAKEGEKQKTLFASRHAHPFYHCAQPYRLGATIAWLDEGTCASAIYYRLLQRHHAPATYTTGTTYAYHDLVMY